MTELGHYQPRKKKSRFRFWVAAGAFLLFGALCIGLVYFILRSPWLKVRKFEAPDLPGVSSGDVLDALKTQMLAVRWRAFLGPQNILFWGLGGRPDALFRFPVIKNLEAQADFWNRSVKVAAEERRLWGVVCGVSGSGCYGVDENGVVFAGVPDVSGSLLLKITDVNDRAFILGQPLFSKPEWFSNFKEVIAALGRSGFPVVAVKSVDLSTRDWTADVLQGPDFYFSLSFRPADLDSALKNLVSQVDFKKAIYIDFRVPNRIYYKYK